jgi:hypothetical protein
MEQQQAGRGGRSALKKLSTIHLFSLSSAEKLPPGAKAHHCYVVFAARLKPCPCYKARKMEFFRSL